MSAAKLSIDIEARIANLQAGLDKAGLLAEKQAARIASAFSAGGSTLSVAIPAATIAGFAAFFRKTVDGVDKLNDLKDATGASIENLSALEDIAQRTGTSLDTAGDAVIKMNKALADAKPGSDQAAAFEALGLSVEELKRLDPVAAFQRLAVALSGFSDDANKARLVQELFGKSLKEVAPLLKDTAEAGKLVATVTSQQAQEAEALNKQLFAMQKESTDLARVLASKLVPSLNEFFIRLREGRAEFGGFGGLMMASISGKAFVDAADGVAFYTQKLKELDAQPTNKRGLGFMGQSDFKEDRAELQKFLDFYKKVNAQVAPDLGQSDPRELARRGRGVAGLPSLPAMLGTIKPGGKAAAALEKPFVANVFDQGMSDALKSIEGTDTNKIRALNEQLTALFTLQRETRGDAGVVQAIAKVRAELEKLDPEAQKAAESAARLKAILSSTPSSQFAEVLTDIELINKAFTDGQISAEKWAEASLVATGKLKSGVEDVKASGLDVARELGLSFSSAFEDAIVQGSKLRDVLDGLAQDLARILVRKSITEPLAASITGSFKGLNLFSADGNAFGAGGHVIPFARGGIVDKPTMFGFSGGTGLMGEAGPEAILPLTRGRGGKLGVVAQGGGGNVVHQTISIDARGAEQGVEQRLQGIARQIKAETLAAVQAKADRGGAFAASVGRRR